MKKNKKIPYWLFVTFNYKDDRIHIVRCDRNEDECRKNFEILSSISKIPLEWRAVDIEPYLNAVIHCERGDDLSKYMK